MSTTKKAPRPKGDGAVYEDNRTGRWVGQLDLGTVTGTDGRPRRIRRKVTGKNRTEVAKKLDALRSELATGKDVTHRAPTVAEVVAQWSSHGYPGPRGPKQSSTIAALDYRLKKHLLPSLGRYRIDELRPEHIERWWKSMADAGFRHATILDYRSDIVQLLNWAGRRTRSSWNPAKLAHLPAATGARDRIVLDRDERAKLYLALRGNRLEALFVMLAELGMRPGEAEGLRWSDLDLDEGLVSITGALKRGDRGRAIDVGDPKTKKSVRTLELTPRTVAALQRHRVQQATERLKAGPGWCSVATWTDLVFTTELGGPLNASNVRRSLRLACKKAGVPAVTPYELRHTAATILCQDAAMEDVMDALGHTDTRMLERVYRHRPKIIRTAATVEDRHHIGTTGRTNGAPSAEEAQSDAI